MMRMWPCWQPRGNSYPCKVGSKNKRNYLERIFREIETKTTTSFGNSTNIGSRLTTNWMQHTPNRSKPSMRCRFWWPNKPHKTRRLSIRALQEIQSLSSGSNPDPDAQQTILSVFKSVLSMQSMGCRSVSEQLMAAGATDEEVKKISQIMAQTVRKLEGGSTIPEPGIEALKPACDVVVLDAELPSCIPGFSSMDIEGQEAIKRSLSNAATEKRRLAKKCKQEEDVL